MQTKFRGEQFRKQIGFTGAGYAECSQIIVVVYNAYNSKIVFVKQNDVTYPDSPLIEDMGNKIIGLWFTAEITNRLTAGTFSLEVKRVIDGVHMPILKSKLDLFTLVESKTK